MKISNQIIENHGLKLDEYKKIQELLKRDQIYLNWVFFQQCGMTLLI